jgi:hypothetical protein
LSRICEEFTCLPSEALRELRRLPVGLLEDVMEARAFAAVWAQIDRAKDKDDIPQSPMRRVVERVMEAAVLKDIEAKRGATTTDH